MVYIQAKKVPAVTFEVFIKSVPSIVRTAGLVLHGSLSVFVAFHGRQ